MLSLFLSVDWTSLEQFDVHCVFETTSCHTHIIWFHWKFISSQSYILELNSFFSFIFNISYLMDHILCCIRNTKIQFKNINLAEFCVLFFACNLISYENSFNEFFSTSIRQTSMWKYNAVDGKSNNKINDFDYLNT